MTWVSAQQICWPVQILNQAVERIFKVSVTQSARMRFICGILIGLMFGCGSPAAPPPPPSAPEPLTVEEWRDLEISEKYDEGTFERLKLTNPKLKSEREWDLFMKKVVIPERKIDMPGNIPGRKPPVTEDP
jgi:hypothetical protein